MAVQWHRDLALKAALRREAALACAPALAAAPGTAPLPRTLELVELMVPRSMLSQLIGTAGLAIEALRAASECTSISVDDGASGPRDAAGGHRRTVTVLGDRKTQIIVQSAVFRIAQMHRATPRRGKDGRRDGPRSGKAPGAGRGQLGVTVRFKLGGDLEPAFWREALPAYCESHGVSHTFVDGGPGGADGAIGNVADGKVELTGEGRAVLAVQDLVRVARAGARSPTAVASSAKAGAEVGAEAGAASPTGGA